jgi:hypothetical protein
MFKPLRSEKQDGAGLTGDGGPFWLKSRSFVVSKGCQLWLGQRTLFDVTATRLGLSEAFLTPEL